MKARLSGTFVSADFVASGASEGLDEYTLTMTVDGSATENIFNVLFGATCFRNGAVAELTDFEEGDRITVIGFPIESINGNVIE